MSAKSVDADQDPAPDDEPRDVENVDYVPGEDDPANEAIPPAI